MNKTNIRKLTLKEIERVKDDEKLQAMLAFQFGMTANTWKQYAQAIRRKKLDVPAVAEKVREYIAKFPTSVEQEA